MRLILVVLVAIIFVLAGVVFGALNPALVGYDLGFAQIHVPKGAAVLAAVVLGWLLGGIVAWFGTRVTLRRKAIGQTTVVKRGPTDTP